MRKVHKLLWQQIVAPTADVKCRRWARRATFWWQDVTCKFCLRTKGIKTPAKEVPE